MSTTLIFVLGSVITAMVTVAVLMIGLMEVADPTHSRPENLASWEREVVKGKRNDLGELRGNADAD